MGYPYGDKMPTYWNSKGKYQSLSEKLSALIPSSGEVGAKALEQFRIASNCYYDFYNNGLGNRAAEFRKVFGFGGTRFCRNSSGYFPNGGKSSAQIEQFEQRLDAKMDSIILAAAAEQGL